MVSVVHLHFAGLQFSLRIRKRYVRLLDFIQISFEVRLVVALLEHVVVVFVIWHLASDCLGYLDVASVHLRIFEQLLHKSWFELSARQKDSIDGLGHFLLLILEENCDLLREKAFRQILFRFKVHHQFNELLLQIVHISLVRFEDEVTLRYVAVDDHHLVVLQGLEHNVGLLQEVSKGCEDYKPK